MVTPVIYFPSLQPHVRAAAVSCLNAWYTEIGLAPMVEQEFISGALATENPNLRAEVNCQVIHALIVSDANTTCNVSAHSHPSPCVIKHSVRDMYM